MKKKVAELEGAELDYWVSKAISPGRAAVPEYSREWAWGGPIIERERISIVERAEEGWAADCRGAPLMMADKPLIAAMRAYVASKLGDEVSDD